MKTVIYLGTKSLGLRCLQYLLSDEVKKKCKVVGVLTRDPQQYPFAKLISELAASHGIITIQNPDDLLKKEKADFLVSVQYHKILLKKHIERASELAINLHMAPLPEYRGCNQFSIAILEQKKEFGTTLHVMDERIDHGDILFESRFAIPKDCYVDELVNLTEEKSVELFQKHWKDILAANYQRTPQKNLIDNRGTSLHYRDEISNLKKIDPAWPEEKISRHIKATTMPGFSPPYTEINGQLIEFGKNSSPHMPNFIQSSIRDVYFGKNVRVVGPVNMYGCTVGDECFIGPFTEIQKNVQIGNKTKIQSHSFVCELVSIGDSCFIGHGVMFINDTFQSGGPALGDVNKWIKTSIGNHVSIGSNATILPVSICDGVVIGAGSVVTKDIEKPGIYAGNPAKFLRPL